jgi:hypothetical protein
MPDMTNEKGGNGQRNSRSPNQNNQSRSPNQNNQSRSPNQNNQNRQQNGNPKYYHSNINNLLGLAADDGIYEPPDPNHNRNTNTDTRGNPSGTRNGNGNASNQRNTNQQTTITNDFKNPIDLRHAGRGHSGKSSPDNRARNARSPGVGRGRSNQSNRN